MVDTRPTGNPLAPHSGGVLPDSRSRGLPPGLDRPAPKGRPGNRWPSARDLAALVVDGFLHLPARYRRGMYLDILV